MRKYLILLSALFLFAIPAASQEVWLGAGGLIIPESGNAAYATFHQEAQFSAGWLQPVGKRMAFNVAYSTDTVDAQEWLVEHAFADTVAIWSYRYHALDLEAHVLLTPGSKWALSAFAGATLYHTNAHDWGGVKAGLLLRRPITEHLVAGAEVAARHAQAGPFGPYTVGELSLRLGWRF